MTIIFYGHVGWVKPRKKFFRIHTLELSYTSGSAFAMFAHKKIYGYAGYVDDPLTNIVYIAIWMPACIAWLYYEM